MNIQELGQKINSATNSQKGQNIYIVAVIILVALASFGLGRLSKIEESKPPVRTIDTSAAPAAAGAATSNFQSGTPEIQNFVASRNGTKYHFPWCSGAQNIKEANKIWFETKEEAEKAGYGPAANCKGL